ncbi:hypothetical protein Poly30_42320 [Planctomycetes bacterium Poly30]|uniref:TM2 domain protein n=1 Tax=Saltatorellus ferox TaxID=2528018 RepID=A0A518EX60_9BACT|nr:hypothetical protein Poly30_42320 [Planctomycetes bacterium Poly30]
MVSFSLYRTPTDAPASTGSAGNVIAALASFFAPGLGQLIQGRFASALVLFLGTWIGYSLWFLILPGLFALALHLVAILDAATFTPGRSAGTPGRSTGRFTQRNEESAFSQGHPGGHRVHFAE